MAGIIKTMTSNDVNLQAYRHFFSASEKTLMKIVTKYISGLLKEFKFGKVHIIIYTGKISNDSNKDVFIKLDFPRKLSKSNYYEIFFLYF